MENEVPTSGDVCEHELPLRLLDLLHVVLGEHLVLLVDIYAYKDPELSCLFLDGDLPE